MCFTFTFVKYKSTPGEDMQPLKFEGCPFFIAVRKKNFTFHIVPLEKGIKMLLI